MENARNCQNPDAWLKTAISSILNDIPKNRTVRVREMAPVIALRAQQDGVSVETTQIKDSLAAACIADGRPVQF